MLTKQRRRNPFGHGVEWIPDLRFLPGVFVIKLTCLNENF